MFFIKPNFPKIYNLKTKQMKKFCLLTASSVTSALKMKASADGDRYPGEPYRPPYLEKVTKDLSADLNQLIPD